MSKKKYLCIMRSQPQEGEQQAPSPAQMEQMFAKFNTWKEKFADNIVDMGGQLGEGKVVRSDGVSDGPFSEVSEIAGGFMVVEAETLEEAVTVAEESPGVFPGSSVEVRQINSPG